MDHHIDMQICFSLAAKDDNLLAMLSPAQSQQPCYCDERTLSEPLACTKLGLSPCSSKWGKWTAGLLI